MWVTDSLPALAGQAPKIQRSLTSLRVQPYLGQDREVPGDALHAAEYVSPIKRLQTAIRHRTQIKNRRCPRKVYGEATVVQRPPGKVVEENPMPAGSEEHLIHSVCNVPNFRYRACAIAPKLTTAVDLKISPCNTMQFKKANN